MPRKELYRQNPTKYRRQRRAYYKKKQKQARAYSRKWRAKNRKQHRSYQRRYYRKHRKQSRHYQERWYKENREVTLRRAKRWAKRNPRRRREISRGWERTRKGKTSKQRNTAKRRARIEHAGSFTATQWRAKLQRYNNRCARCRRRRKLQLHHIKPLADGGRNTIRNVLPLCKPCHDQTHRELRTSYRMARASTPSK